MAKPMRARAPFLLALPARAADLVVDEMLDDSAKDPRAADIFRAADMDRLRRTLKEQFVYLLGAPVDYSGRDMKSAHKDQGLQRRDFHVLVECLQVAMEHERVRFRAQKKLLAKLAPLERDVVVREPQLQKFDAPRSARPM